MTPAVFKVSSAFPLAARKLFVLPGVIESGVVKAGMTMQPASHAASVFPISSLEFVDYGGEPRRSEIALCTPYRDERELALFQSLFARGLVLEIHDSPSNEPKG